MGTNTRQSNFEILRVLAMLMIIAWHLILRGVGEHLYSAGGIGFANYVILQFITVICSSCVNLFVLVSGYFLVDKPFNWRRMTRLWMEVVFYTFTISLITYFTSPGTLTVKELLKSLSPVYFGQYWFFQKYFGLVCLAPFLSKVATALEQKQYKRFLGALVLICCTLTLEFPYGDLMGASKGFHLIWFIALFFFGGYFKRFAVQYDKKKLVWFIAIAATVSTAFILAKAYMRHSFFIEAPAYNGIGFLITVPIFLYFRQKTFAPTRFWNFVASLAPLTFGVYLIHEHTYVRPIIWYKIVDWPAVSESVYMIPAALAAIVAIFLVCAAIEFIRIQFFKICRVDNLTDSVSDLISSTVEKLFK